MDSLIELDLIDLVWAAIAIAIAASLSAWQRWQLEGQILLAAGRSLVQLLVVGYILAAVFAIESPLAILAIVGLMVAIATQTARNRIAPGSPRLLPAIGGSLAISALLAIAYGVLLVVRPPSWYDPQYAIPMTGIVLGNAANGVTLAGERLVKEIERQRGEIETHLSLGATPRQATLAYRRAAVRAGLIPNLNQMMLAGVVTLPGVLTGQLLGGIDPLSAVSYQILVLFLLAFITAIAMFVATEGIYRQYFNDAAQLK